MGLRQRLLIQGFAFGVAYGQCAHSVVPDILSELIDTAARHGADHPDASPLRTSMATCRHTVDLWPRSMLLTGSSSSQGHCRHSKIDPNINITHTKGLPVL